METLDTEKTSDLIDTQIQDQLKEVVANVIQSFLTNSKKNFEIVLQNRVFMDVKEFDYENMEKDMYESFNEKILEAD